MPTADSPNRDPDHYRVLGVSRRADHDRIRRAYLEAARRWHPDRITGRSEAEAGEAEVAMRRVNEAWAVLGDEVRREAYDRQVIAGAPRPGERAGINTTEGVTRIDPRLLDPEFLTARREAQIEQISGRSSLVLRAFPVLGVLGLLAAILIFTAYARGAVAPPTPSTVAGPSLGQGIEANDCVQIMSGPSFIEIECGPNAVGRVVGAYESDGGGSCPLGTVREVVLTNGLTACLASAG